MTEGPLALDVPSVAQLLTVSKRTVEHLIARGELASFRIGRSRRVRRVDVELFLESKVAAELEATDLQVVPVAAEAISLLRGKKSALGGRT